MPVIAVINRKGGSGKSTLATHLAVYCALTGKKVMLGDVDRQQSAQTWLKLRGAQKLPPQAQIQGWAIDPKNTMRAPAGVTHVILDTPGGMRGFELARIVMSADAILMPVCNSVFDRESAAECFAELKTLPRVATGRCKVAAIGMRLDARTRAHETLSAWAQKLDLPYIGILRETQAYVRCIENGLTLFDLPKTQIQADITQWKPIVAWLEDALRAPEPTTVAKTQPEPAAKPVPAQVLTNTPPQVNAGPRVPASIAAASANAATPAAPATLSRHPRSLPQVERAPLGELVHAGTLASIGELARTMKAAEAGESAQAHGAQSEPAPVPLRPTRPIVAPVGRPNVTARAADVSQSPPAAMPRTTTALPHAARPQPHSSAPAKEPRHPAPANTTAAKPAEAARTRAPAPPAPARPAVGTRLSQLLDTLPLPRFLQRNS